MKLRLLNYCTFFLLSALLTSQSVLAQTPTIVSKTEYPTGSTSRGIAFGNNVYVSILDNRIYASSNGTAWHRVTGVTALQTQYLRGIAFGNGFFVAVGSNGLILRSVDGETWTTSTSNTTRELSDVIYEQGFFLAVGSGRTLLRSANGSFFTALTVDAGTATDNFSSIAYGNSTFAISARNNLGGGGFVYYSPTLVAGSWATYNITGINSVVFLNNRFFAFCSGQQVLSSTNASSWTTLSITQTLPNGNTVAYGNGDQIFTGMYDGTRFLFFGNNGNLGNSNGGVWTSTNGTSLTLYRTGITQGSTSRPLFVNNRYFFPGANGIATSTDGINYRFPTNSYNDLASNGTSYVGVGGVEYTGMVFTSADFTNWTDRTPNGLKFLSGVTYGNNRYLAVGKGTVVESTDNGVTWTELATSTNQYFKVAYGGSRFVAVGQTSAGTGIIQYSANGTSWTTANSDNNYYYKVKYLNGRFFAVGTSLTNYAGIIYTSTDGITWTDITPSLSFTVSHFNEVIYDGSKYHFMGADDLYAFFSISTATPLVSGSYANKGTLNSAVDVGGFGEGAFAAANGRFAGATIDNVEYKTYVLYSGDGISWTPVAIDERTSIFGAAGEANRVLLLGTLDGKITVTFNATLPVHFSGFTARQNGKNVVLDWQTATEQNSHHFTVQHSTDAANWQSIAEINAAGQSVQQTNYTYTHTTPAKGRNFYRIAQTDIDGRQQLTDIQAVLFRDAGAVQLYPNPAKDWVEVRLAESTPAFVRILDIAGNTVYQNNYPANTVIRVPVDNLAKGAYQVQVTQGEMKNSRQLIKQ